jgi:integrase/recombinase XerC
MTENWLKDFLQYLRFEKRYSPLTITAYQKDIQQFIMFYGSEFTITEIPQVSHFHLRSWLAGLKDNKMSARSLNRKISSLSSFYKYLLKNGLVDTNPTRQLHAQRLPERLPVYLKEKETEHLLEEVQFEEGFKGFTDRVICDLLYQTGMRRAELLQLKETDVEWSLKQVRVLGKGNKERLIPVNSTTLQDLKDYITAKQQLDTPDTVYLLNTPIGKKLYAGYVYRTVKTHLGQVTTLKKKSPHVLRHTFATHLLNNGANIQAIKDLLGHSSLAATQVYTHNNIEKLKEIHKMNHPRG